jgi:hypothetical protein
MFVSKFLGNYDNNLRVVSCRIGQQLAKVIMIRAAILVLNDDKSVCTEIFRQNVEREITNRGFLL